MKCRSFVSWNKTFNLEIFYILKPSKTNFIIFFLFNISGHVDLSSLPIRLSMNIRTYTCSLFLISSRCLRCPLPRSLLSLFSHFLSGYQIVFSVLIDPHPSNVPMNFNYIWLMGYIYIIHV